jgi:hypothetical protein
MGVELPIDHLRELWPEQFRGARIAALLHPASVSAKLEHASHILERHNGDLFQSPRSLVRSMGFSARRRTT